MLTAFSCRSRADADFVTRLAQGEQALHERRFNQYFDGEQHGEEGNKDADHPLEAVLVPDPHDGDRPKVARETEKYHVADEVPMVGRDLARHGRQRCQRQRHCRHDLPIADPRREALENHLQPCPARGAVVDISLP